MGSRRKNENSIVDELFDLLEVTPVWVGPVLALVLFAFLRWLVPLIFHGSVGGSEFGDSLAGTLSMLAVKLSWFAAIAVLVIWLGAELKKLLNRQRLDGQTGSQSVQSLNWREFEGLLAEAFRRQGFIVEQMGGSAPDGGIDIRLNKAGAVTLVQCKHWKSRQVGVKVVRELLGVVHSERAQSGIVVTAGRFSNDAIAFAKSNPIRLIDGSKLVPMIAELQRSGRIANTAAAPQAAPVRASVVASNNQTKVSCPQCGSEMVRRRAKRGANAGSEFWGCSQYPACRGTRDLSSAHS